MKKEKRLDIKIRRLFKQAGHPRWVHHMGPKKFETWTLCLGLVIKQVYRLSYRRAMKFLDEYFSIEMHWTTLQKAAKRLPKSLWQSIFSATLDQATVELAAGDGTGFARSGPSNYYLRRIDREGAIGRPVQLIALVDVKRRKFLAGHLSAVPKHEARKVPTVHRKVKQEVETLLWDKAADAEWLHAWLYENGTFLVAPVRKNCRRGRKSKVMRDYFDWCLYWQRNIVESLFSALKRLFGSTFSSRTIRTQTANMFCRLIAYNIGIIQDFFY
jgi:transposase